MKTALLAYSFILSSSLLFAQNKQNDVELLRQSSEIIFNNAVSSADIAVLKQASAVVPEILPIAQAFENRAFDKNQAKHIAALKAIAEKIGKDGEENSIAYIQSLFYLADHYYGTSDYDNAQKLFSNALNLLEKLPYSEQKTQSHIKTQWHFLLEYKIISSKDFGHETADWVLLENWLSEATSYIDSYSGADTYEMMYLCLYIVWAGNTFDFPFSNLEHYYQKGLSIANSKYKDRYEINAYYSQVFADYQTKNGLLDAAEKIYSDNLKRSEELYGNINYYKIIFLSRLANIDAYRGDLASAVQKQKECIRLDNIFNDNSNLYFLNSLVTFLLRQGSESKVEAEQHVKEAVEKSKKIFGEISNQHISALQHQIEFYQQIGDVAAERECLKKIHNIALETANKKPLDAVIMLKNISENYEYINAYNEVIAILDDAIKILKEKLKISENPIDYADILSRQSQIYEKKGLYDKAQTLAEEVAKILSKADNKLFYAVALQNLAGILNRKEQQSKEALKQIKSAYQICRTNQLENNETFVYILLRYAKILQNNNDIKASEDKLKEAITIAGQLPNNALLLGMCYQAYGDFFYDANKLESTLTQFKKAEQQYQKCGDNGTVKYLELLQNMGSVYAGMGKLDSARICLNEIVYLYENKTGQIDYGYFKVLNSLIGFAINRNNVDEATVYVNKMSSIVNQLLALSNNDETFALEILTMMIPTTVNVFLEIQRILGFPIKNIDSNMLEQYPVVKTTFIQLSQLLPQIEMVLLGTKNKFESIVNQKKQRMPGYIDILFALGDYYYYLKYDDRQALRYYQQVQNHISAGDPQYPKLLGSIANVYTNTDNIKEAISYKEQSIAAYKKREGENSLSLLILLNELAILYGREDNYSKIAQCVTYRFNLSKHYVQSLFTTMSETDRLNLQYKYYLGANDIYYTLAAFPTEDLARTAYDGALFYKGLLLRSSNRIRESIYKSNNAELIDDYEKLNQWQREKMFAPVATDSIGWMKSAQISASIDSLDWRITQNPFAVEYRKAKEYENPQWTDVRDKLKEDEIAIEFITTWDLDDYKYSALLLRKEAKAPIYVPLFKEKQLTDIMTECGNDINKLYIDKGKQLYEMIWQPIEANLQNETAIYYSPVKKLYSIAFSALPSNGKQNYNFKMLSSTAELVYSPNLKSEISQADVFGEITYGEGHWHEFNTIEASTIDSLLHSNKLVSNLYTRINATEETFRKNNGNSATWIHLDTHGEYEKVKENEKDKLFSNRFGNAQSNPMNRAMLIMANANKAWDDENVKSYENDGVLLASEIADMNLDKTDLLVLSACKTGLGEESETEGIFGLQRAFKLAGVKTVLMTLWAVDAKATSLFMTQFYGNLANRQTKQDAFQNAVNYLKNYQADVDDKSQKKIMNKRINEYPKKKEAIYNSPYYWAAYVMLD